MHNSLARIRARTAYLFLLPAIIIFAIGLIVPLGRALELSFSRLDMGSAWEDRQWVGIEQYQRLADDLGVQTAVSVTLRFAVTVLVTEMILGIALALLLEKPIYGASVFRTIFILPLMVSPVAVGLIWRYLFDGRAGLINYYLSAIGNTIPALKDFGFVAQDWLGQPGLAFSAIVITDVWQWTPFIFIIILAGLQAVPAEVIEAAQIDGANRWQVILRIKLPMLRSLLLVTILMRLIDVFRALEVIFILTNGGPGRSTEVLSLHIYKEAFVSQNLGFASTISVLLMGIMLLLSIGLLVLSNPLRTEREG